MAPSGRRERDKPWIMRTYAGHSTAVASNELYRTNLAKGQTGLSVAFDLPTQTGYDADDPLARGEVGKVGVPISHLGDMRALFEGLPLPASSDLPALLLTGLAVSGGAFILQVWAQTVIGPTRTAIVLALEPVFAVAFAAWLLDERLTTRGWIGSILILSAIYAVLTTTRDTDEIPAAEAVSPAH